VWCLRGDCPLGLQMCILDIDVQGAQQVKKSPVSALFIFVAPPSFEELERRLRGRYAAATPRPALGVQYNTSLVRARVECLRLCMRGLDAACLVVGSRAQGASLLSCTAVRVCGRGTETEEQVAKRLRNAKKELESGEDMVLFNHRIVNDDLEAAYAKLKVHPPRHIPWPPFAPSAKLKVVPPLPHPGLSRASVVRLLWVCILGPFVACGCCAAGAPGAGQLSRGRISRYAAPCRHSLPGRLHCMTESPKQG